MGHSWEKANQFGQKEQPQHIDGNMNKMAASSQQRSDIAKDVANIKT